MTTDPHDAMRVPEDLQEKWFRVTCSENQTTQVVNQRNLRGTVHALFCCCDDATTCANEYMADFDDYCEEQIQAGGYWDLEDGWVAYDPVSIEDFSGLLLELNQCKQDNDDLIERIAAAEKRAADAEAQVKAVSSTYGELVHSAPNTAKMIEPHEWDNKTPSEQRDWAVAQIEALSPPISREEIERSYRGGGWIGFANRFNAILAARLSSAKGGDDGK